ncbi:MAG: hypothetical protein K2Q10_03395 [Rhodospirillales bacterium]|nr:hypothetical protein [Rhodospirillales bacterium]
MMRQTFKAICPATKDLQVFEIVRDKGRMTGWCTRCRQVFPLSELTDGKRDEAVKDAPRAPRKRK